MPYTLPGRGNDVGCVNFCRILGGMDKRFNYKHFLSEPV